ncbi:MAG TPA: tetratricopeptide repeat protein [Bacteroidetes bacterium]|nr:tetratricopeptide repeat protein [Bacteroidota bacterium]
MGNTGLSDVIRFGDREVYIETSLDEEQQKIVTKVLDNSYLLSSYEKPVGEAAGEGIQLAEAEKQHREVVADWKHFFYLYEKVKSSRHAPSAVRLGRLMLERNLFPEAVECFRDALRWDPENVDAVINLARAYYLTELFDEAVSTLRRYEDRFGTFPDVQFWLGAAYLGMQEFPRAIQHLERALEINPHYDAAHFLLGKTYVSSLAHSYETEELIPGPLRQKKALGHLQRAIDLNPLYNQAATRQAMKEIQNGRYDVALEKLEEVELFPKEVENHFDERFYLDFLFGGKSKDDELIENYIRQLQQRLKEHPDFPDLHNQLGVAYLIQCRNMFLKAMEQFRKALKLNPNFQAAKRNLKLAENEGKGFIILLRALLK